MNPDEPMTPGADMPAADPSVAPMTPPAPMEAPEADPMAPTEMPAEEGEAAV